MEEIWRKFRGNSLRILRKKLKIFQELIKFGREIEEEFWSDFDEIKKIVCKHFYKNCAIISGGWILKKKKELWKDFETVLKKLYGLCQKNFVWIS